MLNAVWYMFFNVNISSMFLGKNQKGILFCMC